MKLSYKQRLFLYFAVIFTVFTAGILIFEQIRERDFKTDVLENRLDSYAQLIKNSIDNNNYDSTITSLRVFLPKDLRITIVNFKGKVLYDNSVEQISEMNNHIKRPEIVLASKEGRGKDIRVSGTDNNKYFYYAIKTNKNFIRVALLYDVQLKEFLGADNIFLYFIFAFFLIFILFIQLITNRFSKFIVQLRDFALQTNIKDSKGINFPDNELGEIGRKIADNYYLLNESKKEVQFEKHRLLQHIQILEEGICFISSDKKVELYNGLFIQYLNTISDNPLSEVNTLFTDEQFNEIHDFLAKEQESFFETKIEKQGKIFSIRVNVFEDKSYEVVINNITKQEKTKNIKQEITSNIAHEIRTPITSIRGFLETIINQDLEENKKHYFIEKAYNQTIVLTEIIKDMSLISRIEEAPNSFNKIKIRVKELLQQINNDYEYLFNENNIKLSIEVPENTIISGNTNLLNSIFRNLIDNSIRYAGKNSRIVIKQYNDDAEHYFFSYYDTGVGSIDEKYLNRIFERFYRVNEGRTRDTGGSGLGLSIVKNAIQFHQGNITAKNRQEGGLEFLFTLGK